MSERHFCDTDLPGLHCSVCGASPAVATPEANPSFPLPGKLKDLTGAKDQAVMLQASEDGLVGIGVGIRNGRLEIAGFLVSELPKLRYKASMSKMSAMVLAEAITRFAANLPAPVVGPEKEM